MTAETDKALDFLAERNVLSKYMGQATYVMHLIAFIDNKGEEALQALAGFYIYCIDHITDETKQSSALITTFAHDLLGSNIPTMLPRSSEYKEFWDKELRREIEEDIKDCEADINETRTESEIEDDKRESAQEDKFENQRNHGKE